MRRTVVELRALLAGLADGLSRLAPLSEGERRALCGLWRQVSEHPVRSRLAPAGDVSLLVSGWGCRQRAMTGRGAQIVAFLSPGDVMRAAPGPQRLDAVCLTHVQMLDASCLVAHPAVAAQHPALARALHGAELRAQEMLIDHIVRLGARDARGGLAHLMLELEARAAFAGEICAESFHLPIGQRVLGRALGLSIVHVNRTLARLREERLLEVEGGRVRVIDRAGLTALAIG